MCVCERERQTEREREREPSVAINTIEDINSAFVSVVCGYIIIAVLSDQCIHALGVVMVMNNVIVVICHIRACH